MAQELQNPLFARFFHRYCGRDRGQGERELRRELLAGASGRVVEVGAGNGINFEHYPVSVTELIAVEPEPYLRHQAEKAAVDAPLPVRVMPGVAASLELEQDSVDVVVVCGVLCSVADQREALAEFRRVLRPGGELRFYEHVRSRRPGFARWQRQVDWAWSRTLPRLRVPARSALVSGGATGARIRPSGLTAPSARSVSLGSRNGPQLLQRLVDQWLEVLPVGSIYPALERDPKDRDPRLGGEDRSRVADPAAAQRRRHRAGQ